MSRIFQSDILDSSHNWPIGRNEELLTCLFHTSRPKKVLPIVKKHRVLQQFETFRSKQHGTCGVSFVYSLEAELQNTLILQQFCVCIPRGAFKQACEQNA